MTRLQRTIGCERSGPGPDHWQVAGMLAVCLGLFMGAGCSSTDKPDSTQPVSVVIHGRTHEQVRNAAAEVFREHGYKVMQNGWASLVFEKKGSTMDRVAYGSWMESGTWVRVKVSVADVSRDDCRLECEAFVLRGRGEPLEEEIRLKKFHRQQYQELLNEIVKLSGAEQPAPH